MMRAQLTTGERFHVLERDRFTCQACGAQPGNAGLEVDHLLPWSRGGSNDPRNLTTLCRQCNQGKGARVSIPRSMLATPEPDAEGFAIWKRFGPWSLEVCASGLILNLAGHRGYTWVDISRCWESDWLSHFQNKRWFTPEVENTFVEALAFAQCLVRKGAGQ